MASQGYRSISIGRDKSQQDRIDCGLADGPTPTDRKRNFQQQHHYKDQQGRMNFFRQCQVRYAPESSQCTHSNYRLKGLIIIPVMKRKQEETEEHSKTEETSKTEEPTRQRSATRQEEAEEPVISVGEDSPDSMRPEAAYSPDSTPDIDTGEDWYEPEQAR